MSGGDEVTNEWITGPAGSRAASGIAETGVASPHNLVAVRAAMDVGQAVVELLTAEDQAGLLSQLAEGEDEDTALRASLART